MKIAISAGILIVGSLFGWIGQLMDHGNWLGGWSLLLGTIGSFAGIWVGYKVYKYFS